MQLRRSKLIRISTSLLIFTLLDIAVWTIVLKWKLQSSVRIPAPRHYVHFENVSVAPPHQSSPIRRHVYHFTREYGKATFGGLGAVVSSLAEVQEDATVVVPFYPMFRNQYHTHRYCSILIRLRMETYSGWQWNDVEVVVYEAEDRDRNVRLLLIGTPKEFPFNNAFERGTKVPDIYYSLDGLPQEWQDLYFLTSAASLLAREAFISDRPVFAMLHGAGIGMLVHFYYHHYRRALRRRPAFVYVMHDYSFEQMKRFEVRNMQRFSSLFDKTDEKRLDGRSGSRFSFSVPIELLKNSSWNPEDLSNPVYSPCRYFCIDDNVYAAPMSLLHVDAVVFVSSTVAQQLVQAHLSFPLKFIILPAIQAQFKRGWFFGITNGIDIRGKNPFTDPTLRRWNLSFPMKPGYSVSENLASDSSTTEEIDVLKRRAKSVLRKYVAPGLLESQTVILFIGRFEYDKGIDRVEQLLPHLKRLDAHLIVMAFGEAPRSFQIPQVTLLTTEAFQKKWGMVSRVASDIVLIPTRTEAFGLVAVEGLLFGSLLVTSNTGGLAEFTIFPPNDRWNAILIHEEQTVEGVTIAVESIEKMTGRPEKMWQWVEQALDYRWQSKRRSRNEQVRASVEQYEHMYRTIIHGRG